jgi:O-methyltransferase
MQRKQRHSSWTGSTQTVFQPGPGVATVGPPDTLPGRRADSCAATGMSTLPSSGFDYPRSRLRDWIRGVYVRWIRPRLSRDIDRQRMRMLWEIWGYWPILMLDNVRLLARLRLLWRFVLIDWHVLHSHSPREISAVCRAIAERPAEGNEAVVEAGCWQGGSSAKLSAVCRLLGYRLRIYDSFAGVEEITAEEKQLSFDFSGQYASSETVLWENLRRFGEPDVCLVQKGWFAETLAPHPLSVPVRIAYIDCDLAKGTREVLAGVLPALTCDGAIFSQDFHLLPVQRLLSDEATWRPFRIEAARIVRLTQRLVRIRVERVPLETANPAS